MANRVLLGQRGADYGLWISKPGQNVLTAPNGQLLFAPDFPVLQVLYSQTIRTSGAGGLATYNVNWPNPGYYAFTWVFASTATVRYTWTSQSSITFQVNNGFSYDIFVIVFNVPRYP